MKNSRLLFSTFEFAETYTYSTYSFVTQSLSSSGESERSFGLKDLVQYLSQQGASPLPVKAAHTEKRQGTGEQWTPEITVTTRQAGGGR